MPSYEDRIIRVIDYIYDNPTGDLSLDRLADVAAMSRFHWHRVFRAMTGETCAAAVKRIRMHRASVLLVQGDDPVAQVGAAVGYSDLASFTRAFSESFGMPPAAFRKSGQVVPRKLQFLKGDPDMLDVEIKTVPERRLAALSHQGAYPEIGRTFQSLYAMIGARGLFGQITEGVAVFHDDPGAKPAAELHSHAGVTLKDGVAVPEGLEPYEIPGGRAAVALFKGPYSGLPAAYDHLYCTWLPGSGEELGNHPSYEVYLNDPTKTAPEDLLTHVVMPLR